MCFAPQQRALLNISTSKSVPRLRCFLYILSSKCASRYNGVHFFDISTSALRATTPCTSSTSQLPNVVRTRCVLYILTCKCASRHNGVHFFNISTSKSAPKLRCFVHFDFDMCFAPQRRAIFHFSSPRRLRTRRFSEPTFRPSGATNHWKNMENIVFRDFATFSRTCIFCLLTFCFLFSSLLFSELFPPLLFHLSILSEV